MTKTTALVTGGAGFIGSHIADHLISNGHSVVVLDDLSGGFKENVNPQAEFIQGSVADADLVKRIFETHKIDYVFHIAAYAAEGLSHFIKKFNYETNLIGSINLINAAVNHSVRCFVFTSSIAVYGKNQLPMTEDLAPMPEDSYGISKLAVELELKVSHEMFGLPYIIFRPHNVYGSRQNIGDRYRNVIGIFINNLMQNKPLLVFGDGSQTRAFSYIDDVAPIIARSIQEPKAYQQVFNVGADQPHSINDLIQEVAAAMKVQPQVKYDPPRNEVAHAYSKHDKVRKFFNPPPPVTLKDGVQRMVDWCRKAGSRQSSSFGKIEIMKNLPPSWIEAISK